jgi:S1-C subfamily serine protease
MRFAVFLGLFLALLLTMLQFACTKPTPAPVPVPVPVEPIALGPEGSLPLVFLHVVERLPAGTLLGVAHWENSKVPLEEIRASGASSRSKAYNVSITNLLREHGYTVTDEADAIFTFDRSVQVRYQLAGVIHGAEVDFAYDRKRSRRGEPPSVQGWAKVDMELQVFDTVARRTVFKKRYSGEGVDSGTDPQPWVGAVADAVRQGMADPEFVAIVTAGGDETVTSKTDDSPISVPSCGPRSISLPDELDDMMETIVVVRAGGSLGTGVIVSEYGHVLTAEHVIGDSAEPMVGLRGGPDLPAQVLVRNQSRDLALLKIPGQGYACSPVVSGEAKPEVGSDVYSFSVVVDRQAPVVSRGVFSGYLTDERSGRLYVQTDAAVNPGSSGGPLFDGDGYTVGIVVEKITGAGYERMGLAVPGGEVADALGVIWKR